MKSITADRTDRLDRLVKEGFELSNKKARSAIRTGKICVDDVRVTDIDHRVRAGATLALDMAAPNPARTEPHGVTLLFRDDYLLVLAKPAGLLSAPAPGSDEPSALTAAQALCKGPRRPKVVHRLDKETSGVLVFARSVQAARALQQAIQQNAMHRTYACVLNSVPQRPRGVITSMLMRDRGDGRRGSRRNTLRVGPFNQPASGPLPGSGKHAITRYKVITQRDGRAAAEVRLGTGRTHQIRIHMAEIGCPILGERVYARDGDGAPRQALHAVRLAFKHPANGRSLDFFSPWPADLAHLTPLARDWLG